MRLTTRFVADTHNVRQTDGWLTLGSDTAYDQSFLKATVATAVEEGAPYCMETVILVHGTFANPEGQRGNDLWWKPGSEFCEALDQRLEQFGSGARCWKHVGNARIGLPVFEWSGNNDWIARKKAAEELSSHILLLLRYQQACHIVAHSHGGNVVMDALEIVTAHNRLNMGSWSAGNIVTMGTPFLTVEEIDKPSNKLLEKSFFLSLIVGIPLLSYLLHPEVIQLPIYYFILGGSICSIPVLIYLVIANVAQAPMPGTQIGPGSLRFLVISSAFDEPYQLLSKLAEIGKLILDHVNSKSRATQKRRLANLLPLSRLWDLFARADRLRYPAPGQSVIFGLFLTCFILLWWGSFSSSVTAELAIKLTFGLASTLLIIGCIASDTVFAVCKLPLRIGVLVAGVLRSGILAAANRFIRRNLAAFIQQSALGTSGFPFSCKITQLPINMRFGTVRYLDLPQAICDRTISRRSEGIVAAHMVITDVLAKPEIAAAEMDAVLAELSNRTDLVHAAYYKAPEMIDEIARWIARSDSEVDEQTYENVDKEYPDWDQP